VQEKSKNLTAWIGEKLSRFKLGHDNSSNLRTFETLEFLALGIQGKLALWRTLTAVQSSDERLFSFKF